MTPLLEHVILHSMVGDDKKSGALRVVIPFWREKNSVIEATLDQMVASGIHAIGASLPVRVIESDVSHSLFRFLMAARIRNLDVALLVTPEVGTSSSAAGWPTDLLRSDRTAAKREDGSSFVWNVPPLTFELPSLLSPANQKRLQQAIGKLESKLFDLSKHPSGLLENVSLLVSSSHWKHYRDSLGEVGDFSGEASGAFRARVERRFQDPEFSHATQPTRWAHREHERRNRLWFHAFEEEVFRTRVSGLLGKRSVAPIRQIEFEVPEYGPTRDVAHSLDLALGARGDLQSLDRSLSFFSDRVSTFRGRNCAPCVYWGGVGTFRSLSDVEKQFLIMRSLLSAIPRQGEVWVDWDLWLRLSAGFRARAQHLASWVGEREADQESRCLLLTPCVWGETSRAQARIAKEGGFSWVRTQSVPFVASDRRARLVWVDSEWVLREEDVIALLSWVEGGGVLCVAQGTDYSETARRSWERLLRNTETLNLSLGSRLSIQPYGLGKVVFCENPEKLSGERLASLASITPACRVSDARISVELLRGRQGEEAALFVLNPSLRGVGCDLIFSEALEVSDFSRLFRPAPGEAGSSYGVRFSVEVPPCGMLPLTVSGLGVDMSERREAQLLSEITSRQADQSAIDTLPGYAPESEGPAWI